MECILYCEWQYSGKERKKRSSVTEAKQLEASGNQEILSPVQIIGLDESRNVHIAPHHPAVPQHDLLYMQGIYIYNATQLFGLISFVGFSVSRFFK